MSRERSERLRQRFHRRQQRLDDRAAGASGWACGIKDCSFTSETVEELITHQSRHHPPHTCKVCERVLPAGFGAIFHVFEAHNRTEYVRAYDASPEDVRQREELVAAIERQTDVPAILDRLEAEDWTQPQ